MAKEFKATQNVFVIGKVLSGKVEEKESKSGDKYKKYSIFIKLPEGTTLTVEKMRYAKKDGNVESDFEIKGYKEFEEIINNVTAKKDVYISKSVFPPKEEKKNQFDWITAYENDEGKITYKISGFPKKMEHYLDKEKVFIKFKESNAEFDTYKSSISVRMFVTDTTENKIYLTDGKSEHPNQMIVNLPEGTENKAVVGKAYEIKVKPVKGKKISLKEGDMLWDEGTADEGFSPDTYVISAIKGIDAKLDGVGSSSDILGF